MTDAATTRQDALRMERRFEAAPEDVFDAWTNPEVLRRWWAAAPGWETPSAEVDLRAGGRYRLTMRDPEAGAEHTVGGEYVEVRRPDRLTYTWAWEPEPETTEARSMSGPRESGRIAGSAPSCSEYQFGGAVERRAQRGVDDLRAGAREPVRQARVERVDPAVRVRVPARPSAAAGPRAARSPAVPAVVLTRGGDAAQLHHVRDVVVVLVVGAVAHAVAVGVGVDVAACRRTRSWNGFSMR